MSQPWDFQAAEAAARKAITSQKECEKSLREAAKDLAEAERQYRQALAIEILNQHANGCAWSAASDLARGTPEVADLRYKRDVAKGALEAVQQQAWRYAADRKDVQEFTRWSRARDLAEGAPGAEQPAWTPRAA